MTEIRPCTCHPYEAPVPCLREEKGAPYMSEVITVTISGPVGCGKSAICGEIEIALRAIGVPGRWYDEGEKNMTHSDWQTYLEMYRPSVVML